MEDIKNKYAPQARYAEKLKARTKMYRFRLYTDKDADIIEFLENYSGMASRFIKEAIREKMKKKKNRSDIMKKERKRTIKWKENYPI